MGKQRQSRDATPHQSQEPNSRAQSKVFPSGNQGGLCWLHTHHSSDPVISALFTLFLLVTCRYLPETRIFSLKTAKSPDFLHVAPLLDLLSQKAMFYGLILTIGGDVGVFRHKFSCCLSQEGQHRCPPAASPPHPADLASEMPQECPRGALGSTGGSGWVHLAAGQCSPMHCAARSLAGGDERQQMRAVRLSRCLISHSTVLQQPCSCPAVPRGGQQQPALEK